MADFPGRLFYNLVAILVLSWEETSTVFSYSTILTRLLLILYKVLKNNITYTWFIVLYLSMF